MRIEALNPLVKVETYHDESILQDKALDDLISRVNLVCATDWDREGLVRHRHSIVITKFVDDTHGLIR